MPITYRSNPPSRDIKPMLEVMKKPVISEDVKNWTPHLITTKPKDKVIRDFKLRRKIEAEEAKLKPPPIPRRSRRDYIDQISQMISEGMTYRQIAAALELTAGQVSGMVHRMRGKK